jgi:riboflavin synthase
MFTGIIQAVGRVESLKPQGKDVCLSIATSALDMADVSSGDSIAVNGACLTVERFTSNSFQVHVSAETLACTTGLDIGDEVNLEKAMRVADRLGGHLVSGHVDGVGAVTRFEIVEDCRFLAVQAPHALSRYIAAKGSITVNGVSLTVNAIEKDTFSVNLIPHTLQVTNLKNLQLGSKVNLEVDMIARYLDRMQQWTA